jgi:hypothetical protein
MRAKSHSYEGYGPGAGRSTPELTQQLGIEAERGANKHAAAAVEYKKKKPKPHYAKSRKKQHFRRNDYQYWRISARLPYLCQ